MLDRKGRNVVTVQLDVPDGRAAAAGTEGHWRAGGRRWEPAIRASSERDIVRPRRRGAEALASPVSGSMTTRVLVCHEQDTVNQVMEVMTNHRIRHLPVERDGRLEGIISIGDVVRQRIEDVEREAEEIRNYIATA